MNLSLSIEYICQTNLNIYDSPSCNRLATQAKGGRYLKVLSQSAEMAVSVCLVEDNYPGWLLKDDLKWLERAAIGYQAIAFSRPEIESKLPEIIAFTQNAMQQLNCYLWGGTLGPNYDCSGLMQAAFAASGIWIPRDAYQQEAFLEKVSFEELQPGDFVFFGNSEKATHVGLYLGNKCYIHSSGEKLGRNGIAIDELSDRGDEVSKGYYRQLRGFGRVVKSYEISRDEVFR
ncbi:NlpC/P60 family protein [Aerosakkonemataceae cyanobacterium BLCC-F154]|uniref:NlpC/P60 family protein n=1 Tax=Floridaenema fluviatile BLCC-F154 TaxID=3153640 RepID=A0ABV4Y5T0_9CYAN